MESIAVESFFSEGVLRDRPSFSVYRCEAFCSAADVESAARCAKISSKGLLRVVFAPDDASFFSGVQDEDMQSAFSSADEVLFVLPESGQESFLLEERLCDLYASCRKKQLESRSENQRFFVARSFREALKHCFLESSMDDAVLLFSRTDGRAPVLFDVDFISGKSESPEDLKRFSFFGTGGKSFSGGKNLVVGMGSNLWISDLSTDVKYIRSHGGASVPGSTLRIPWMAGIPGSIGGWVKMNAGAFGHSISEVVKKVKVDGRWIGKDECGFSYRSSSIDGVIEDVEFDTEEIKRLQDDFCAEDFLSRRKVFPPRTCGSVFKNPSGGNAAGYLLEKAGAKEMSCGGAVVWSAHANVIVAHDGANSSDIYVLICRMRQRVREMFGIELELEIANAEM